MPVTRRWKSPLAEINDVVVSSESEALILVDENDREIGFSSKDSCHDGPGILHRAFSLFIFNTAGELLLQQRSAGKRLWPLYWSNSCCSHPRAGETMELAVNRRLQQELHPVDPGQQVEMKSGVGEEVGVEVTAEHVQRVDDHEDFVRVPDQLPGQQPPAAQAGGQCQHSGQGPHAPDGHPSYAHGYPLAPQPNRSVHVRSNSSEPSSRRRSSRIPGRNTGSLPARKSVR